VGKNPVLLRDPVRAQDGVSLNAKQATYPAVERPIACSDDVIDCVYGKPMDIDRTSQNKTDL
jgi:hypothetical protein